MKLLLVWLVVLCLIPNANAIAQSRTASLKAAYIYYFTKFVYWPDESDTRTVCISGDDPDLRSELNKVKLKAGASLALHWIAHGARAEHCDLLFWVNGDWHHPDAESGTLLVIDEGLQSPDAAVSLVMSGTKLSFDINRDNAKANNIEISAKLLGLAREVHP